MVWNRGGERVGLRRLAAAVAAAATAAGPGMLWGAPAGSGVFSSGVFGAGNQDASVGLNANKTYQTADNVNGPALTINGVTFAASTSTTAGPNFTLAGATTSFTTNTSGTANNGLTPQLGALATDFTYNGNPAAFTLNNLTAGQTYVLTYYNVGFGNAGGRVMSSINASDGGTVAGFDENMGGAGVGDVLRYTFVAPGASETLSFTPQASGNTYHFYGFSNEQVFNNNYTGVNNGNWSAIASWSVTPPNYAGSNAVFPASASATTVNLDGPETVGHIQFQGNGSYTIAGTDTLSFQADVGGTSVLSALAGTHTIATPVSLSNGLVTFGPGTIVLTNNVSSNSNPITVSTGTLQIGDGGANNGSVDGDIVANSTAGGLVFANATDSSYGGSLSGTGAVTKTAAGNLSLTGAPASGSAAGGTFTISGGTVTLNNPNALQNFNVSRANATDLVFASFIGSAALGGLNDANNLAVVDASNNPLGTLTLGFTAGAPGAGGLTTATFSGNLSGDGTSIVKVGTNTQVFSGTNTYTGATFVNGGTLEAVHTASLPGFANSGQVTVAAGATLALGVGGAGDFASADLDAVLANVAFNGTTAAPSQLGLDTTDGNFTYNGNVPNPASGVIGLTKLGANTLTLGGTNTYTGPTLVSAGTLLLNNANAAQNSTVTVTPNNGLQFGTGIGTFTIGALAGAGNITLADTGSAPVTLAAGGNNASTTYSGVLSGPGGLTKAGTGTLTLSSAANTYTGATTVNGGVLAVGTLAAGGSPSSIGASSNAAANLVLSGGTLRYTGAAVTTDRLFTLGPGNSAIDSSGSGAMNLSNTGPAGISGTGARSLTLTGSNTGANTLAASLADQASTALTSLTKTGAGTWNVTGTSTYTGVTTFGGGILNVSGLTDYGVPGPLGARLASQEVSTNVGLHFTGGTLQYTGSTPQSTNRQIRILGSATGVTNTIDASGSTPTATLSFTYSGTNADFFDTGGIRTLQLTGSNTGNNLFNIAITDQSTNPTTLIKSGAGTWVLGGTMGTPNGGFNGYTGGTLVQNGTLQLASTASLNPVGAVTLGNGTNSGVLVLGDANGPVNQTVSALSTSGTGAGNAVVGGSATPSTLTVNYTNTTTPATYGGLLGGATGSRNNLNFVKAGAGTLVFSANHNTYTGSTAVTGGTLRLGGLAPAGQVAHYTFDASDVSDSSGNGNNGTPVSSPTFVTGVGPAGKAINFNGSGQYATVPYSASLGQTNAGAYTVSFWENINSTTQNANAAFVSTRNTTTDHTFDVQYASTGVHADIGNGGTTWLTTAANATVSIQPGVWNMVTYAVTSTGWTIYFNGNSVASGTYSGTPQLIPSGDVLSIGGQKAGGASFTNFVNAAVDEVNIYPSALTSAQVNSLYNAGLLGNGNILPPTTPLSIASGATFDLMGTSQAVASISDFAAGSAGSITNGAAVPSTLTVSPAGGVTTTFSGVISDTGPTAAISLIKSGAGTQVLAGPNTYNGPTTITGGTLQIGADNAIPAAGGLVLQGGTLNAAGHSDSLGATSLAGPATIQFGAASDGGNVLTLSSIALNSGSLTLTNWDGNSAGNGPDQLLISGAAPSQSVLQAITFLNPDVNGTVLTGTFAATTVPNGSNFEIVPGAAVPEPAALGVLGVATLGLLARRRRKIVLPE